MKWGLRLGVLLASASVLAQDSGQIQTRPKWLPSPRILSATGRVKFGMPLFGATGRSGCDSAGDMFFDVGTRITQMGPFLKVSSDGRKHTVYSLPSDLSSFAGLNWAVAPRGVFYALHGNFKEYKLVRFKDDGSVDAITDLALPANVYVTHLAIADDEVMYLQGYRDSPEPLEKARAGFAALLNPSGKMIHDLSAGTPEFDMNAAQHNPTAGDAVAGEDGRFYVLGAKELLILNQNGETAARLEFQRPAPDAYAIRVDYSKGVISIVFHTIRRSSPAQAADVEVRSILLNSQTGEQQGYFAFDPELTGNIVCFDGREGYSMLAVDGKMEAKDMVPIR